MNQQEIDEWMMRLYAPSNRQPEWMKADRQMDRFEDGLMTRTEIIVFIQKLVDEDRLDELDADGLRLASGLIDTGDVIIDLGKVDCE